MKTLATLASLTILLTLLAGCGGGESAPPHAPGEIERLPNATIYHLKDGVFIHEVFEGADHYYLVDDHIIESYELTQERLGYVKENGNAGVAHRAPVGEILCILRESDSSSLVTKLKGEEATIKRVIESFNADATVESVRNLTRRPTAQHVARFTHGSPDSNDGVILPRVEGEPYYGFDETNVSYSSHMNGAEIEVNLQFRLLASRDGKDIYEITRTVINRKNLDDVVTTESKGKPVTMTVEYSGKELIVFDDEYGVAKFVPAPKVEPKQSISIQTQRTQTRKPGQP